MSLAAEALAKAQNAYPGTRVPLTENGDSTRNHDALQDALTRAKARRLPVLLPPGKFAIDPATIEVWDGFQMLGAGGAYTAGRETAYLTQLVNEDTSGAVALTFVPPGTGKHWGQRIADFEVLGNEDSGHGVKVGSTTSGHFLGPFNVERVVSRGHGGSGFFSSGYCDQFKFDSCVARDNTGYGFGFYDESGPRLKAQVMLLNCHGNFNNIGMYLAAQVLSFIAQNCEFASNSIGWEVSSVGSVSHAQIIGGHCERNSSYHAQVGTGSVGIVRVQGMNFMDNVTNGLSEASIRVRMDVGRLHIEDCSFSMQNANTAFVKEEGTPRIIFGGTIRNTSAGGVVNDVYLRKLPDGTLTNVRNGGPTAYRWPTGKVQAGEVYFDTDLGKPIWYTGSGWVDATGADPDA